jgi:hypothetical protein
MKRAANTPDSDAIAIWDSAREDGVRKYREGRAAHKTCFWTAGAEWYVNEARAEVLDMIAYIHHAKARIQGLKEAVKAFSSGEIGKDIFVKTALRLIEGAPAGNGRSHKRE